MEADHPRTGVNIPRRITALYRGYLSVMAYLDRSAHKGHPITRQIAAPVLGADGKRRRRKGGRIVLSQTETRDNPHTRYARLLSDADLARMLGFDADDKRRRHDARGAVERLARDGVCEIVKERGGMRLFGPPKPSK